MNNMLQVTQVAKLAQVIEKKYWAEMDKFNESGYFPQQSTRHFSRDNLMFLIEKENEENGDGVSLMDLTQKSAATAEELGKVIDPEDVDPFTGGLSEVQKTRIVDLLGQWEEPDRDNFKSASKLLLVWLRSVYEISPLFRWIGLHFSWRSSSVQACTW